MIALFEEQTEIVCKVSMKITIRKSYCCCWYFFDPL